jgi:hypothetical protein
MRASATRFHHMNRIYQLVNDIIYNQDTFQNRFLEDLANARKRVLIVSPFITQRRVRWLEATFVVLQCRDIPVTVITRPPLSPQNRN